MDFNQSGTANAVQQMGHLGASGAWAEAVDLARHHFGEAHISAKLFHHIARQLCDVGLIDAADKWLTEGLARWPQEIWLLSQSAELATHQRDFDRAADRWEEVIVRHPDHPVGICGLAKLHRIAGREAVAGRMFAQAVSRFPDYVWAAFGDAVTPSRMQEWPEAVRRWSDVVQRFPDCLPAYEEFTRSLIEDGRLAEAAKAVRQGLKAFPDSPRLAAEVDRILQRVQAGQAREVAPEPKPQAPSYAVPTLAYRCPTDLAVSPTPLRRVMVIGSCGVAGLPPNFEGASPGLKTDFLLFNNGSVLPEEPPHSAEEYDFQVVQIAMASVLRAPDYSRLSPTDLAAYQRMFDTVCERMSFMLSELMGWNRKYGMLTFVCNFIVPQQNPMGRLLPRYDLRNFVYFVEKLNEVLEQELKSYGNAYLFDQDQLVAAQGRRSLQDDVVWSLVHGTPLSSADFVYDQNRLEPLKPIEEYYPTDVSTFVHSFWVELQAMYRTVRQVDMVKLVLFDLDDTLWRGVVAEDGEVPERSGWPMGLTEALHFLRQRGVLLGVVSKNDEARVLPVWHKIFGDQLTPDDFAIRKINWRPKADNIEEILAELNLLPHSAVFIDDNPVERASVKAAFPTMRVLGENPYLWRRILLWSAETQVAAITKESAARTGMVQAQVQRETQRKQMTRGEFLASLGVRASLTELASTTHPQFPRAIELINKTNQFNTTGRRWTAQEFTALFADGGRVCTFDVADKFTAYGIVGVLVVHGDEIVQFVMSCRVVGMDVELAAVSAVLETMGRNGQTQATTSLVKTAANLLCRELWKDCGFKETKAGRFVRTPIGTLEVPSHLNVSIATG